MLQKNLVLVPLLRDIYRKPIILDEINYEGNINSRWGQLTGQQMTHRFWTTYVGGGYATHGESYKTSRWISNGGVTNWNESGQNCFPEKDC